MGLDLTAKLTEYSITKSASDDFAESCTFVDVFYKKMNKSCKFVKFSSVLRN